LKSLKILKELKRKSIIRKWLIALLLIIAVTGVSGCHTLSFYGQALRGQYQIFANEQPINKLIGDTRMPERLRQRFQLLEGLRAFAQAELKLPIDDHYRKYADLHRPFVVWNVEAEFVHLVTRTRKRLETLYGDTRNAQGKVIATLKSKDVPPEQLRRQKEQVMEDMKQEFGRLKQEWNGETEYDWWFSHQINNAHLNSVAAYYDLVPSFEQILAANGGDLEKFYRAVERLAKLTKKERHDELWALARANNRIGYN
jgi:predicted aminopeptidase